MNLIDIGCNLTSPRLYHQRKKIIADAHAAGVHVQILTGTDPKSNSSALALANEYKELFATAGHHPHHADDWENHHVVALQQLAAEDGVVAVGEMGLDYNRNFSKKENQRRCFEDQLRVAVEVQKPVFLHEREAYQDFIDILSPFLPNLSGAVWHCFTGNRDQLAHALELGLYIGITGWVCDPRRGKNLRQIVAEIPEDRLMLETDAPYLTPKNMQPTPRTNEPQFLPYVLDVVAQCRGESREYVAEVTTANAKRFFALPSDL